MFKWKKIHWISLIAFVIALAIPLPPVLAQDQPTGRTQGHNFLRASLVPGAITSRVNGEAVLELSAGGINATATVAMTAGQPLTAQVQMPFASGSYVVSLLQSASDGNHELFRVRGNLVPKGPGVYEHSLQETSAADPDILSFSSSGSAVTLEAGSVRGSAVLLLLPVKNTPLSVSLGLSSSGTDNIDITREVSVQGSSAQQVETEPVDGLPLTSQVRAEVRNGTTVVGRIDAPFDLANFKTTANPVQELSQDEVKAMVLFIKRVPMVTKIQIAAARLSPPPEQIAVQPQEPEQNSVAAFGDVKGVRYIFQTAIISGNPAPSPTPLDQGVNSPGTTPAVTKVKEPSAQGWFVSLGKAITLLKNIVLGPVGIVIAVFVIAGLITLILVKASSSGRAAGKQAG